MAACDVSRAIAAIRWAGYIGVMLIPACLPALGCGNKPDPPPEVKSQAVKPEETPIESFVDIEGLQEVEPPQVNDSPKKAAAPSGERKEKEK